MDKNTIGMLGGIISLIAGLVFVILHKQLGQKTADFYYRLLHINFSERGYQVGFLLVGIAFVVFGLLSVFQLIRFR